MGRAGILSIRSRRVCTAQTSCPPSTTYISTSTSSATPSFSLSFLASAASHKPTSPTLFPTPDQVTPTLTARRLVSRRQFPGPRLATVGMMWRVFWRRGIWDLGLSVMGRLEGRLALFGRALRRRLRRKEDTSLEDWVDEERGPGEKWWGNISVGSRWSEQGKVVVK